MYKIYAPNKSFTGKRNRVSFMDGKGETENKTLLEWFKSNGYEVEGEPKEQKEVEKEQPVEVAESAEPGLSEMTRDDLRELAKTLEIKGYGKLSKEQLITEIQKA